MSATSDFHQLPDDLPVPEDDGAADHLPGAAVPPVTLEATDGTRVDLAAVASEGTLVVYVYPQTGVPGRPVPAGWDQIPGGRGCTPQSCAFRDSAAELAGLGATVFGLSAQPLGEQREFAEREHLPHPLLNDSGFRLAEELGLPTFEADGSRCYRRLTFVAREIRIAKVFYPVFPPQDNAAAVTAGSATTDEGPRAENRLVDSGHADEPSRLRPDGVDYSEVRRADPRIETVIWDALGDAQTVLNVGAGAGSYEPGDREVIAVEPSPVMIAQRPPGAAAVIQGVAEDLPLADDSVDAAMGVFTMQHWQDVERGLGEVLRVTRERVVLLTLDVEVTADMWLARDYLPELIEHDRGAFPSFEQLEAVLPSPRVETVPVPSDCTDGFCVALWSRPEAHLEPAVRQASSIWHRLPADVTERGLTRLRADLESGEWERRYGDLRERESLDVGLRLVRAELT